MPPTLHPNPELVGVAFLGAVYGDTGMVGTTLPKDTSAWADTGFVTVGVVGGSKDMYVPSRATIFGLQFWAVKPSSTQPPWGMAANLAEQAVAACDDPTAAPVIVTLPGSFPRALVQSCYPLGEPIRQLGDPANYARYTLDYAVHWRAL